MTRLNSSLLQAVLSLSMAPASAEATHVALHRRRRQFYVHDSSRRLLALPACRSLRERLDSLELQAMLLLSLAVASEEAACAALRRRRGLLCALNSSEAIAGIAGTPFDT